MPAHEIHIKTVEDHPLDVIPTMDDAHIPPEIARDTEVDSKINTHKGDPSAHHIKTHDAGEITSGTFDDARIPAGIARDADVDSKITTHADNASAHHAKYTNAEADARADAKVATHDELASPHAAATAVGGKTLGLDDGNVAVLPVATENQVLKRGATGWEAGPVPAEITVYKAEAEPAIAADSVAIWCDTTVGLERWWLVFGTDGTVEGNKKVEMG